MKHLTEPCPTRHGEMLVDLVDGTQGVCPRCNGYGVVAVKEDDECEFCGGTGLITEGQYDNITTRKCSCRKQDDMDDNSDD